jgi:hypothetical protein
MPVAFMSSPPTNNLRTGDYTGLTNQDCIRLRKEIEDVIGLEEFYEVERQTVESR